MNGLNPKLVGRDWRWRSGRRDMRIAMLCAGHRVDDERVTHKQAVSLAREGHEVMVFGRPASAPVPALAGLTLRALTNERGGRSARARVLPRLYREVVRWKPDVVTCHEPETALLGLVVRARTGCKAMFDSHECYEETFSWGLPQPFRSVTRRVTVIALRRLIPKFDWVTVVSPPNQEFLGKMRHGRVDILHNSPHLELFPQCSQEGAHGVTVVHDGYLYRQRGMIQMLEAVAIVRKSHPIRLLLLGRVLPADRAVFDGTVGRLNLADCLIIPGWMPWEQIGRLESQAQIGLICPQYSPNAYRTLNNKLYNYMACGQAIVGPEKSATADMLRKYDCGVCVDTSKPEAIAAAIVTLVTDTPLRKRLGANGRRAIEEELGWHKMAEKMSHIYGCLGRA